MGWWLADAKAGAAAQARGGFIKRFDPRFWTVDFPRPMMAAVTTTAPDALRIDAVFYKADDLAGLIWEADDRWDHPLTGYETARDFRGCRLSFGWASSGVLPLDAVNGPTLTIEGRDATGTARSWYVRLWNYATGTPEDAAISLDFDALTAGFRLPDDADQVFAGDIDRLFVSLVPADYRADDTPLRAPIEAWVTLTGISCTGRSSVIAIADGLVPAHGLRIATGYDDAYNLTPARVIRTIRNLGYRGVINHYVGMSHYFRLAYDGGSGLYLVSRAGGALNVAAAAWHAAFAASAKQAGFDLILSLSYELLDQHCFGDWKQRAEDGSPALTGWDPPSALLSPANAGAMAYLQAAAQEFVGIVVAKGLPARFQIGEPWWWLMPDGRVCLYDAATRAALGDALVSIADVRAPLTTAQTGALEAAGALLAQSTAALAAAVRAVAAGAELLILVYMPTVLDPAAPELRRANVPLGWAAPAFDVLQLEDYDWAFAGNLGATTRGIATMTARLGYPATHQHYFAGFVLAPEQAFEWSAIDAAAGAARARGTAETFTWALPQVARDGFVHFEVGDVPVQAFDDVAFPLAIGAKATVAPSFSTAIVTTAAGQEQRNAAWADARLDYDAGPGVRSEADVGMLIAFFRARRGAARGFRFRDPLDDSSAGMTDAPGTADQAIGIGDGIVTRFPLVKSYGPDPEGQVRRITRPAAGSVRVSVGGAETAAGWSLDPGGIVSFGTPPAVGAVIAAGFRFDVPVRFAEDRLEVSLSTFLAGDAPSVPLIELREDAA